MDHGDDFVEMDMSSIIPSEQNDSSSFDAVSDDAESVPGVNIHSDNESDFDVMDSGSENESDDAAIEPLYKNCPCSVDEAVADMVELYVNHKWTKKSLSDLLTRQQKFLPPNNKMPKTLFKLFGHLQKFAPASTVIRNYYCKQCLSYNSIDPRITECSSCKAKKQSISFFFEIDLRDQLKYMFEHRNLSGQPLRFNQRNNGEITVLQTALSISGLMLEIIDTSMI